MEHSDPEHDRDAAVLQLRLALERLLDEDRAGHGYEDHGVAMLGELPHKLGGSGVLCSQEVYNDDCKPLVEGTFVGGKRSDRFGPVSKDEVMVLRSMFTLLCELQRMQAGVREPTEAYSTRFQESTGERRPHACDTHEPSVSDAADPKRMSQASASCCMDHDQEAGQPTIQAPHQLNFEDAVSSEGDLVSHTTCPDVCAFHGCKKTKTYIGILARERDGAIAALSEAMSVITEAEEKVQAATAKVMELQHENSILKSELTRVKAELDETVLQSEQKVVALKLELSSQHGACSMAEEGYRLQQAQVMELSACLSKQESLIELLHAELQDLMEERGFEHELQLQQVQQLQAEIVEKISEKDVLMEQLDKVQRELRNKSRHAEELESLTRASRQHYNRLIATSEGDLQQLRDDNVELKRRLVRLIKDKDNLWHKADMLVNRQREKAEVRWMPDNEATHCLNCGTCFTFTIRKHHCRLCGRIFCARCVNNWIMTVSSSRKARICNPCFIERTDTTSASADSVSTTADAESSGYEEEIPATTTASTVTVTEPMSIVHSMKRWLRTSLSTPSSAVLSHSQSSLPVLSRCLSNPAVAQSSSPSQTLLHTTGSCFEDSYEEITDIDVAELTSSGQAPTLSKSKQPKTELLQRTVSPASEDRTRLL